MPRRNNRTPIGCEPGPIRLTGGFDAPLTKVPPVTEPEYAYEPDPITRPQRKPQRGPSQPRPQPSLAPSETPSLAAAETPSQASQPPAERPSRPPAEPYQVDHKWRDHPRRQDTTFLSAWGRGLIADTAHLETVCEQVNEQTVLMNAVPITPADAITVGIQMATQGLDDGSCIHPGTKRLAGLSNCPEEVVIGAMRALRMSGWAEVQHRPTKTSPTVHRLTVRKEVQ